MEDPRAFWADNTPAYRHHSAVSPGYVGIIFGVAAVFWPTPIFSTLAMVFAAWMFLDGVLALLLALTNTVAESLCKGYADRCEWIDFALESTYEDHSVLHKYQTREAHRHLLHVKREAVRDLAARGQILATTLDTLIKEIDGELAGLEQMADQST